jgi:hypothetical protein
VVIYKGHVENSLMEAAVVYDGELAVYTPLNLWTSTGVCE